MAHSITTLDDISKFFSVPLSDAATNLGVCTSVLKKICRDNGLERWPYRKFQAGKSIEEIKKYAARQKIAELAKIGRQSGSQDQNNEISKLHGTTPSHNLQQQGSRIIQFGVPQNLHSTSVIKGISTLDEFKHGFPSDGLSTVVNKWWGNTSPDDYEEGILGDGAEVDETDKTQSEEMAGEGSNSVIVEKKECEDGKGKSNIGSQGIRLTALRKRSVEEGSEALKLGVCRRYDVKKLSQKERKLLFQIFNYTLFNE